VSYRRVVALYDVHGNELVVRAEVEGLGRILSATARLAETMRSSPRSRRPDDWRRSSPVDPVWVAELFEGRSGEFDGGG